MRCLLMVGFSLEILVFLMLMVFLLLWGERKRSLLLWVVRILCLRILRSCSKIMSSLVR